MFADSRGMSEISAPYIIQTITPISSIIRVIRDKSFVCLVLIARIDCGRKANVVSEAAINPINSVESKLN